MRLCEFVDKCLSDIGVDKVFGIPGALIMPVWQNITDKEIVLCSHEQEAAYVATGYAKMSRKPVCVITTGGPGVTNCISGVASANVDSVPMICISGRTPISKNGFGLRQEESHINRLYDSTGILNEITKKSVCITSLDQAAEIIYYTMLQAVEGRKGAVHISIPIDLQECEIRNWIPPKKTKCSSSKVTQVDFLKKPIFIVGWGCWMSNSYEAVYELAEMVNAPIVVTSKAYCCIKKNHDLYLGKLGYGYNKVIDDFIKEYNPDTIVAFGTSLGEKDIKESILQDYIGKKRTYIIGDDCSIFDHRGMHVTKVETNDLYDYIQMIKQNTIIQKMDKELYTRIFHAKINTRLYWQQKMLPEDDMAKTIWNIDLIRDMDMVITADAGNHLANAGAVVEPLNFGRFFLDVGLRAMGNGICMTAGMAIADNSKTYIAITGDGCMLMNGNIMHLVYERQLPIVFLVVNNHALGRVRVGQSISNDYRATDIYHVDFMAYGKTFGLDTYRYQRVDDCINEIMDIVKRRRPALVEIVTDHDEVPLIVKDNIY